MASAEPLNPTHSGASDAHDSALLQPTADGPLTREQEDELLDAQCWSVRQALTSGYFIANVIISGCINFGVNGGINYALMHKYDYAGLWETPRTPNPYTSVFAFDLFITSFLIVFFTTILTAGGVQNEIKKGTIRPVTDAALRDTVFRLFPTRFKSPWARAFLGGLLYCSVYYGFTLLLLATICLGGGMGGEGHVCVASTSVYPWIKGAWALCLALASWPTLFLGHLNKSNLPQDVYDLFLARQKLEHPDLFAPKHAHAHDPFSHPVAVPAHDDQPGAAGTASAAGSYAAGSVGYGYAPSTSADPNHRVLINSTETGAGTYAQLPKPDRFRRIKH